jgi:MFS transporter, ACS family, tartrate transporter
LASPPITDALPPNALDSASQADLGARTVKRITRRLIPYLFILYIIAFLDRVNVAYAALQMTSDLKFSPEVFGFGAGIFFVGYFLLEIPGALLVERWSARKWIARILITWGLATVLIGFVKTAHQFYFARFFLGMAEAGFFPGMIIYLTHWFRAEDRARAVAMFMSAIPVSNIIGAPVSGLILGLNWFGLEGWRWIFILEGLPAVVFGVITLFYLTDRPQAARWLPDDEKAWIIGELEREKQQKESRKHFSILAALRSKPVLLLALTYFFGVTGSYGVQFWLPTLIKRLSGLSNLTVSIISGIPYVFMLLAMLLTGWSSDRRRERRWHTAVPMFVAGAMLGVSVYLRDTTLLAIIFLAVATSCVWTFAPTFWTLPTSILTSSAAAASVGFINSIGNLGGFAGPYILGFFEKRTGTSATGLTCMVAALILGGLTVLQLHPNTELPSKTRRG